MWIIIKKLHLFKYVCDFLFSSSTDLLLRGLRVNKWLQSLSQGHAFTALTQWISTLPLLVSVVSNNNNQLRVNVTHWWLASKQWAPALRPLTAVPWLRLCPGGQVKTDMGFNSAVEQQDRWEEVPSVALVPFSTHYRCSNWPHVGAPQLQDSDQHSFLCFFPDMCKVPLQLLSVWVERRAARTQRAPSKITKAECVCVIKWMSWPAAFKPWRSDNTFKR